MKEEAPLRTINMGALAKLYRSYLGMQRIKRRGSNKSKWNEPSNWCCRSDV